MKAMTDSMCELKRVLRLHAARYPLMEPTDAVKLIYQNEFGGGHLIRDEQAFLNYLCREYASVEKDPKTPLYEDIGNGIVRVNLAAVHETDLEQLGRAFLRSAAAHTGTRESFLAKLAVLQQMTAQGQMPFNAAALEAYLTDYGAADYPMVSHSETYRNAYHPAYRIVMSGPWPYKQHKNQHR